MYTDSLSLCVCMCVCLSGSVSYDVYTESKSAHDSLIATFASKVTCGETCSAAFSADFRTNMQRSNVDRDLIDNIQADSSASVQVQELAKDQPATNQSNGNQQSSTPSSQTDDPVQDDNGTTPSGDWIVYGVGGLVAIVVVIAVVMVVRSRCSHKVGKMKLVGEAPDQTFSKSKSIAPVDEREKKVEREFDHSDSKLQGNISTALVEEREMEGESEFDRSARSASSILQHNILDSHHKAQILQHNLLDSQNDAHQRLMSRLRRGSVRVKKLKSNSSKSAVHVEMHPLTRRPTGGGTGVDL